MNFFLWFLCLFVSVFIGCSDTSNSTRQEEQASRLTVKYFERLCNKPSIDKRGNIIFVDASESTVAVIVAAEVVKINVSSEFIDSINRDAKADLKLNGSVEINGEIFDCIEFYYDADNEFFGSLRVHDIVQFEFDSKGNLIDARVI